ncbi:MAG TPA: radical SAM/CxCxxxxC motif protein YfkAB [Limnochordia bacterium]
MRETTGPGDMLAPFRNRPLSPAFDPWDPYLTWSVHEAWLLTSIEVTVTNRCNLRCEHCAVGELLTSSEGPPLPLELLFRRLDTVETLLTFSITGGEPSLGGDLIESLVLPLLRYAKARGCYTQINTNLTQPLATYEALAPWVDVFHISFNYLDAMDFHAIAFARAARPVSIGAAETLYDRMLTNAAALARQGAFVAAETIITERTASRLGAINRALARLGVRRHEIHPLYPSDFAADLPLLERRALRQSIERFLQERDPSLWALFGTLPFFACNPDPDERALVWKLLSLPNVTVRNDPDGRSRLNVHARSGEVFVQDFADLGPLGTIQEHSLTELFERWLTSPQARALHCHCAAARCLGPNLIVADTYYPGIDFSGRQAIPPAATPL